MTCSLICVLSVSTLHIGSSDKTVKFWDLETFELIGSAGPEVNISNMLCLIRLLVSICISVSRCFLFFHF